MEKNQQILIKFKKKLIKFKRKIDEINQKIYFYKDVLMSMINNLSYCNSLKIFQESEANNLAVLNELKEIKELMNELPDVVTYKYLKINKFDFINRKMNDIKKLIIKYMNHISSDNIEYILRVIFDDNWIQYFNKEEIEYIIFISKFIKVICIWYSEEHKKEISFKPVQSEFSNRSTLLTKDLFEALLGMKKDDDSGKFGSLMLAENFFLKNVNEIKSFTKRNNHFNKSECIAHLETINIKITKNSKSVSLIEDKYGTCIYIRCDKKYIVLQGIFKDDFLNLSSSVSFVNKIINDHKENFDNDTSIPLTKFKDSYFKTINLRDLLVSSSSELLEEVKKKYNDFKILQNKTLVNLINEFLLASKYRKIDILNLLLMSNEDNQKLGYILFDIFKSKDKKDICQEIYFSLHYSIRDLLHLSKVKLENEEKDLHTFTESDLPYDRRINLMTASSEVKTKAMEKLKSIKSSIQGDSKSQHWLDGLLKIPFNVYKENHIISFKEKFIKTLDNNKLFSDNDVDNYINSIREFDDSKVQEWDNYKIEKKEYLMNVRKVLDSVVFGHKEAKIQLERLFAQWINGETKGAVLGLKGPPGTGKTSLAKNGLSKCLVDKNGEPRPFVFLPIGGSVNGSTLVGHNFTYVGSTWGRIADVLMTTKCMNPIIFIDELDKVSHTEHGREIISILTHLTDATQNDEFEDKFFSGIKLDLSKALIVFSFNDINLIDPILKDRITIIETNPLSLSEKLTIINDYMLPEICKDVGFNRDEIIISNELITKLIETYTNEAGVRKIKEKIVEIVRDINLNRFHKENITLPYTVTEEYTTKLFENKPKVRVKKISPEPAIGMVNGLYATSSGSSGGITVIQAIKFPSDKMLELNITGQAGDVMKESIQYALKNAYSLLTIEEQNKIVEDAHNKKAFAIHVHCPDGATPKDGPSAGLAFTLAMYSLLSGKKVDNKVCMTGEIDLIGNAGIIGGLEAKLNGGKKAGCLIALIPEDNMEDLEIIRREGNSPEDDTFKVIAVKNIKDVLKYAILE
jgi:ATP-dependent Lon protease